MQNRNFGSVTAIPLLVKPDADKALSNLASVSLYLATPDICDVLRNQSVTTES